MALRCAAVSSYVLHTAAGTALRRRPLYPSLDLQASTPRLEVIARFSLLRVALLVPGYQLLRLLLLLGNEQNLFLLDL